MVGRHEFLKLIYEGERCWLDTGNLAGLEVDFGYQFEDVVGLVFLILDPGTLKHLNNLGLNINSIDNVVRHKN